MFHSLLYGYSEGRLETIEPIYGWWNCDNIIHSIHPSRDAVKLSAKLEELIRSDDAEPQLFSLLGSVLVTIEMIKQTGTTLSLSPNDFIVYQDGDRDDVAWTVDVGESKLDIELEYVPLLYNFRDGHNPHIRDESYKLRQHQVQLETKKQYHHDMWQDFLIQWQRSLSDDDLIDLAKYAPNVFRLMVESLFDTSSTAFSSLKLDLMVPGNRDSILHILRKFRAIITELTSSRYQHHLRRAITAESDHFCRKGVVHMHDPQSLSKVIERMLVLGKSSGAFERDSDRKYVEKTIGRASTMLETPEISSPKPPSAPLGETLPKSVAYMGHEVYYRFNPELFWQHSSLLKQRRKLQTE